MRPDGDGSRSAGGEDGAARFPIGTSESAGEIRTLLERVARSEATVLITGETGAGKELAAREIHRLSPRAEGPFRDVNCAALRGDLLLSELFGHVRGAFTGANADKPGVFEQADGGTLFLDEIGDLPPDAQAILLRVLETGEVRRVGGTEVIRVDVRVVSATNKDLAAEVLARRFREDLYFRLAAREFELLPLCQRREDIPEIVKDLLDEMCQRLRRPTPGVAPAAMERLRCHPWPGNVRQMKTILDRALEDSDGQAEIGYAAVDRALSSTSGRLRTAAGLVALVAPGVPPATSPPVEGSPPPGWKKGMRLSPRKLEMLEEAFRRTVTPECPKGNYALAARSLGMQVWPFRRALREGRRRFGGGGSQGSFW